MHEPDWAALADIQFLLYNRISNQLNEALSGIALSDMPEAQDKPPGYWKERATNQIINVLNLFTAWMWLMRFKTGEPIPERAFRPFETNALLAWIGRQLQLSPPPITNMNPLLHGNQETLQEALLLLHSVAYTQGSGVRMVFEATKLGTWFRIRFDRPRTLAPNLDALIASFGDHWRDQDAAFELTNARDFIRLNGCALILNRTPTGGEFVFFVRSVSARRRDARLKATGGAFEVASSIPSPIPAIPAPQTQVAQQPTTQIISNAALQAATSATPPPGPTRPLDEAALARYLERRRERAGSRPDTTPVIPPDQEDKARQPATTEAHESAQPTTPSPAPDARAEGTDAVPRQLDPKRKTDTIIIKARIPEPKLPEHLRKPPATTSNVAVTRDTQTFAPVSAEQVASQPPASQSAGEPAPGETNGSDAVGESTPATPPKPSPSATNGTAHSEDSR